jgi:signal transduction histidine kinase
MPLYQSIVQEVISIRHPISRLVKDYPPNSIQAMLDKDGWKTVVSIPLSVQEKVLGAINVLSRSHAELSAEELAVPAAIGQQIGVAMENARLYNQTVEYARQMEIARQVAEMAQRQAETANAAKSDFLANVSHELRTPLVSILGFTRIVQKRLEDRIFPVLPQDDTLPRRTIHQIQENLEIITTEGQRLTTMINNLLDLEKIASGKMNWHFQAIDCTMVVNRAVSSTAALFDGKPLTLEQRISDGLPLIYGDPDKIIQVLINLISNAVKFTPQGKVRVQVRALEKQVVFSVIDQGIGIAPQDQKLVFDKFRQVGDSLTGKPQGTGLGLAISKEIVEHHGGTIWLESEPGNGSNFSFSVPIYKEETSSDDDAL